MAEQKPTNTATTANRAAPSLYARVMTGGATVMGGFAGGQVLRLLSNLILARLVVPEAFGLMAVAVSVYTWAIMLTDIGINASIVRSRHADDPAYLKTAWTLQIARNAIVWLVTVAVALVIGLMASAGSVQEGSIFANPLLPWVMAGAGLQILIAGFTSTNKFMAERRLAMKRLVALEIGAQLVAMVVTITLAYMGYGVWALVIGGNVSALVQAILSQVIFPGPKMTLRFHREYFSEIFHFGKWLIIASSFGFIVNRGDQILFGWLMESDRFSLYAVATMWTAAAVMVFATVITRIFYPAFSELLRDRPQDLGSAYARVRLLTDGASVAAALGACFLAEPVFSILYPENYDGVGYYIKLMSPVFLLVPYRLLSTVALAAGDSRGYTGVVSIAGAAILIVVPAVFLLFGEKPAVIAFAAAGLVMIPFAWRLAGRHMPVDPKIELRMLAATALLVIFLLNFP